AGRAQVMAGADGIVVRALGAADAEKYRVVRLSSLRHFQFAHSPDYEEAMALDVDWHAKRLTHPGHYWFGAFDGDELVGTICLRTQEGKRLRHSASLRSMMVERSHQRRGIGRILIAHLIEFARSLGFIRQITLSVTDANAAAVALYDVFGFRQYGLEPDAIFHEGRYCARQQRQLILNSDE
ncbi:MAG: N-acetyltransferase family protein, partial [Telluria sp.]